MKATQVENLSKSYLVGPNATRTEGYTARRDVLAQNARKSRDRLTGREGQSRQKHRHSGLDAGIQCHGR